MVCRPSYRRYYFKRSHRRNKITHLAVKDGSEIIAREYKGNSDASIAICIKAPTKVTSKESYKIKSLKVKLNDRSNEMMYTKKDKLLELPHTGESEKANNTLLSSILILGLMLLRKSRKRDLKRRVALNI